jgi:hypothetical protein
MQESEPSEELKSFCMGAILRQFGHVFGLVHEYDYSGLSTPLKFDRAAVIQDNLL